MKNRNEIGGAYPQKNRLSYVSPEVEAVDIQMEDLIAVSADGVDVRNPWGDDEEKEW